MTNYIIAEKNNFPECELCNKISTYKIRIKEKTYFLCDKHMKKYETQIKQSENLEIKVTDHPLFHTKSLVDDHSKGFKSFREFGKSNRPRLTEDKLLGKFARIIFLKNFLHKINFTDMRLWNNEKTLAYYSESEKIYYVFSTKEYPLFIADQDCKVIQFVTLN